MTLFLLLAMALVVLAVLFPFFLQWLAQENVLLTTVKEGTVKAIMHGDSLHRFIMAFEGYHLNEPKKKWHKSTLPNWRKNFVPDWQVLYHGPGNKNEFDFKKHDDDYYDDRHWLLKRLGLYWVGWPWKAKVYVYEFEWNEVITRDEGGNQILARADATDFIYVSDFTYGILTEEAKTKAPKENLPIKVLTLVTVAVRNPYRALFSGEDWLWRVTAAINRHVRSFVGTKKYAELITPSGDIAKAVKGKDFSAPIIALTKRLFDDTPAKKPLGLAGRYGIEIRTADLQKFELAGDGKEALNKAATQVFTAKRAAKATLIGGQATADVIRMTGEQEAVSLEKRLAVIKANGEDGRLLAQLDAIRESSKGAGSTVVWANNPLVQK